MPQASQPSLMVQRYGVLVLDRSTRLLFSKYKHLFLQRFIWCKSTIPHSIILVEFGASPLQLDFTFNITTYIHRVHAMGDNLSRCKWFPYLHLCFLMDSHRSFGGRQIDWHSQDSTLLASIQIQIDRLPPYSSERSHHVLSRNKKEKILNKIQKDISLQYTNYSWISWSTPGEVQDLDVSITLCQ